LSRNEVRARETKAVVEKQYNLLQESSLRSGKPLTDITAQVILIT
jgi:hypothetical protein